MHSNCTCSWLTKQQTSPATLCIASFSRFGCVGAVRQPKAQRPAFHLRKDVKIWLRENGKLFLEKGIIDKWAKDSPMSARKIEDAGTCAQLSKKRIAEFLQLLPTQRYMPQGIRPHMGNEYTCIAVACDMANIYKCVTNVSCKYTLDWRRR